MNVDDIVWLPGIEDKLFEKHNILLEEAEEALFEHRYVRFVEKGHRPDEDLYAAYGQTAEGRYLIVFFILKAGGKAIVISARDMDRKERRLYDRRKGK